MTSPAGHKRVAAFDPRDSERVLWVNVILQAIKDALDPKNTHSRDADQAAARAWFSLTNPDFLEVCQFAGLQPLATYQKAIKAIAEHDASQERGGPF